MSVGKVSPEPIAHNEEGYTKSGRRPDLVKHVPARRLLYLPKLPVSGRSGKMERSEMFREECVTRGAPLARRSVYPKLCDGRPGSCLRAKIPKCKNSEHFHK